MGLYVTVRLSPGFSEKSHASVTKAIKLFGQKNSLIGIFLFLVLEYKLPCRQDTHFLYYEILGGHGEWQKENQKLMQRLEISHHPFQSFYSSTYDFITPTAFLVVRSLRHGISASQNTPFKTGNIKIKYIPEI
jgi:hypothetical protein